MREERRMNGERERENSNSRTLFYRDCSFEQGLNSRTLFYRDCSLGSVKTLYNNWSLLNY